MRYVGTVVRGIRTPIIKEKDDLAFIVVDSLLKAKESEGFEFRDNDIVAIIEAVVWISDGNYVTVDDFASDIRYKYPSRNIRFFFQSLVEIVYTCYRGRVFVMIILIFWHKIIFMLLFVS